MTPSHLPEGSKHPFHPFTLLTPHLILLPTPLTITLPPYLTLYSSLHSNPSFCHMAFGPHFPARTWSHDETREVIRTRDIGRSWERYGVGDFGVGLRAAESPGEGGVTVLEGDEFERFAGPELEFLNGVKWIGYAGIRDARTTSLPPQDSKDAPLPPWQEMVELRYGISPEYWGGGIAKEASEAIMEWGVRERGVRRFIAETERGNGRSARVLEKMGFGRSGTDYWREESEVEWELVVK